jgi:hypothetical protein
MVSLEIVLLILILLNGILNAERYAAFFLLNILPLLLEDIPLRNQMRMWYQHDGCPLHNAIVARSVLIRVCPGHWIGGGGPRTWLTRSPDLTTLDFFMGKSKGHCVLGCYNNTGNMRQRIIDGCAAINPQVMNDEGSHHSTTATLH